MALQIYNTLSRSKENFQPINPPFVGMYVCGPTVYADTHIGHAKSYISFDVVRRYLTFLGYALTHVENITDVGHTIDNDDEGEDKLIAEARRRKIHPKELSETYTHRFWADMERLNVLRPHIQPLASGHIIEQLEMIKTLIAKGFAYETGGNVYFDVTTDKDYGKLSGRKTEDQESSGRVERRSDKRNPQDFALWKAAEPGHVMRWPSPWGDGYPGWHIECSAMSMKYLGETIDIHGGGIENQFPHHECEIAQSEAATGKPFVKYWMHHNMLTIDGKKMGKSLGNSSFLRDLFEKFDPMTLRFFLLQSHYRSTTEFKMDAIEAAGVGYEKLIATFDRLRKKNGEIENRDLTSEERTHAVVVSFIESMNDDFNTPQAIASLYELSKETNEALGNDLSPDILTSLYHIWGVLAGNILGIIPKQHSAQSTGHSDQALDSVLQMIIRWRAEARSAKDFKRSDEIRDTLSAAGIALEDGKDGLTEWLLK
ncbi:MAG TPA: cysteine--tRNA ligase [Candidatus Kapabacteria bacterium]|nr:cysteine--tRNA ligase [Candidatus Kapabacteria bacterium]